MKFIDLIPWVASITNMLWYSFATSIGIKKLVYFSSELEVAGNHQLLQEKILSIPEHITNNHKFPDNNEHKMCNHPVLTGRSKKWLGKESLVSCLLPTSFPF